MARDWLLVVSAIILLTLPAQGYCTTADRQDVAVSWSHPTMVATTQAWQQLLLDMGLLSEPSLPPIAESRLDTATIAFLNLRDQLRQRQPSGLETLSQIKAEGRLADFIASLEPDFHGFRRLRNAIAEERQRHRFPLPDLTGMTGLALGQRQVGISQLRLYLSAYLNQPLPQILVGRDVWDPAVIEQVISYQQLSGLPLSGKLDRQTRHHLEAMQNRLPYLQYSLRQWLQLPERIPPRSIIINIPHFELVLLNQQQIELTMPVIVGKPSSPTPVFNSRFRSLTVNPSWTPPLSIVREELLPMLRQNSNSLAELGFELLQYQQGALKPVAWAELDASGYSKLISNYVLRQKPGKSNPLGQIRFNLVSSDAIYLHDTPHKNLFRNSSRALSHGCIRLADSTGLFHRLLKQPEQQVSVARLLKGVDSQSIRVSDSVTVYVVYMPAWVSSGGKVLLADDIYNLVPQNATG